MRKLLAVLLLLTPSLSFAATKPPEIAPVIKAEAPVGEASLSKLLLHVYDATLWSDTGSWSKAPYALAITYDMNFSADELADRTYDEMKRVSDQPDATLKQYADQVRQIFPNVKSGDRITALQKDAGTTLFYANGKAIGKISDPAFAKPFFGIWLSPKSSEPEMQQKLTRLAKN